MIKVLSILKDSIPIMAGAINIEMKVFKNSQTQQVYNYFSGHGTAVNFLIFGKTITRNFYNGVSIRYYDMPETQ